jgi:hypothetical protein
LGDSYKADLNASKTDRWDNGPIEFFFRFGKAVCWSGYRICTEDPSIKKIL